MAVTTDGWANKGGTGERSCSCTTWKQHWMNCSQKSWPASCFVKGCSNSPVLGGHIYNSTVTGEYIIPMCSSCNGLKDKFNLKNEVILISANKAETCGK